MLFEPERQIQMSFIHLALNEWIIFTQNPFQNFSDIRLIQALAAVVTLSKHLNSLNKDKITHFSSV